MGAPIESTNQKQPLQELRVYPGADTTFDLYNDDGTTYAYEKGAMEITHLQWSDAAQKLTHTGGGTHRTTRREPGEGRTRAVMCTRLKSNRRFAVAQSILASGARVRARFLAYTVVWLDRPEWWVH